MLDRLDPLETDKEVIKKCKHQLQSELAAHLGNGIVRDSHHLYYGQMARCVFYIGTAVLLPNDPIFVGTTVIFLLGYGFCAFFATEESSLQKKYKILIE
jgi:hypothetical protein